MHLCLRLRVLRSLVFVLDGSWITSMNRAPSYQSVIVKLLCFCKTDLSPSHWTAFFPLDKKILHFHLNLEFSYIQ